MLRWLDPLDTMIAQQNAIIEGGYAGKKTRRANVFKLIKDFWSNRDSEDVIEARALIESIKLFRKRGLLKDKDSDRILMEAMKTIEEGTK